MIFQSWAGWSQWVTTLCLLPWYQPLATSSCWNNFIGQFTYRFETVVECMVEPTENIMSKGNYWITTWCLLSRTRCKKKAQILPATHKKGTREQGQATCAVLTKLQKVTVFNDSTERLFVYAVAQQRKEPQFNVGGNTNQMNKVHFDLMKKPVSALFVFKLLPNHPVWLLVGVQ